MNYIVKYEWPCLDDMPEGNSWHVFYAPYHTSEAGRLVVGPR